ncbi:MAG: hypothetical protein KME15_10045 [Drouetiella hepatica Uher 2000/2452]|uniref:Uncharacterized protein n=1 Tax=Drouetiella hepatica Uher 2000/2452 TaxID=904376 RepID=A0A951QA65_9CYAN|nr:hypothetical protein [Drouetiella hepatica Uher 2000/2452]
MPSPCAMRHEEARLRSHSVLRSSLCNPDRAEQLQDVASAVQDLSRSR